MGHRLFLEEYHRFISFYKLFAAIEEIIFILHVVNGIHIITHNDVMV